MLLRYQLICPPCLVGAIDFRNQIHSFLDKLKSDVNKFFGMCAISAYLAGWTAKMFEHKNGTLHSCALICPVNRNASAAEAKGEG